MLLNLPSLETQPVATFLTRLAQRPGVNCRTAGAVSQAGVAGGLSWGAGVGGAGVTQTGIELSLVQSLAGGRVQVKPGTLLGFGTLICRTWGVVMAPQGVKGLTWAQPRSTGRGCLLVPGSRGRSGTAHLPAG